MFDKNNCQFLFKLSNNDTWNFFVDSNKNLCYSSLNRKKQWSKPSIIKANIYPCFYADMDNNDSFHIIFQNLNGDIFYTLLNPRSTKTIQILKPKIPSSYNKHLRLIPLKDSIHFFYILHYKNSLILSHQILKNGSLSNPQILASSSSNISPYSVFVDSLGNISLYYCFFDGKFSQLGYKIYSPFESMWTKFSQVTNSNSNISLLDAIIDDNNITHVLYSEKSLNNYYYTNSTPSTFKCPITNAIYANLVILKNNLLIFWIHQTKIYFIQSQNNGISWSSPQEYRLNGEIFCVKFKSNNTKDFVLSNNIPASFLNGYTLASFNQLLFDQNNINSISTNDFKTIVLDSINLLKNKLESLQTDIFQLKSLYQNLDTKYSTLQKNYVLNKRSTPIPKMLNAETEYKNFVDELKKSYGDITPPPFSTHTTSCQYNSTYDTIQPPNKTLAAEHKSTSARIHSSNKLSSVNIHTNSTKTSLCTKNTRKYGIGYSKYRILPKTKTYSIKKRS